MGKSWHAKKKKQKHAASNPRRRDDGDESSSSIKAEEQQESLAPSSLNNPTANEEEVADVLLNLTNLVLQDTTLEEEGDNENAAPPVVVSVFDRDDESCISKEGIKAEGEEEVADVLLNLKNLVQEDNTSEGDDGVLDDENAAPPVLVSVFDRDGKCYRLLRELKKGGAGDSFCEDHGFVDEDFISVWDDVKQKFCFFVTNSDSGTESM